MISDIPFNGPVAMLRLGLDNGEWTLDPSEVNPGELELNVAATRALGHYTHEKTPLGAAAALAMLDVVEKENLIERSSALGAKTRKQLDELFRDTPIVTEVRGLGLALAVELGQADAAERVMYDCLSNGLSFKVSNGNILTLTPPLNITDEEMARAISILKNAIQNI